MLSKLLTAIVPTSQLPPESPARYVDAWNSPLPSVRLSSARIAPAPDSSAR